jgi:hypothetical protein
MFRTAVLLATAAAGFSGSATGQITTVPPSATGMSFQVPNGGVAAVQSLTISTSLDPTTVVVGVPAGQTWLTVNGRPAGSFFFINTPATLFVGVTSVGLAAQQVASANLSIAIVGQAGQINFPVTVTVGAASILSANPATLAFTAVQGAPVGVPSSTLVSIMSSGAQLSYLVGWTTGPGNWLIVNNTAGTTGSSPPIQVRVFPSSLPPATYSATVTVQSTTTSDSVTIPVTLVVSAAIPPTPAPSTLVLLLIGAMFSGISLRFATPRQKEGR